MAAALLPTIRTARIVALAAPLALAVALLAPQSSAFMAVAKTPVHASVPAAAARCAEMPKMVIG